MRALPVAALVATLCSWPCPAGARQKPPVHPPDTTIRPDANTLTVRAAMLADHIDELAGHEVIIPAARVVGMFNPRVFVIESASMLEPTPGNRDRVLVLIDGATMGVSPQVLVAMNVTVKGIARTLLGAQVTREVPWPPELDRQRVERLDIRAAVVAASVKTQEGDELTSTLPPVDEKH